METISRETIERACQTWTERNINRDELLHSGMSIDHVVNIVTSIICTRDNVSYPGGSFVQAVCNNDLDGAVARADAGNIRLLRFYVIAKNCINY